MCKNIPRAWHSCLLQIQGIRLAVVWFTRLKKVIILCIFNLSELWNTYFMISLLVNLPYCSLPEYCGLFFSKTILKIHRNGLKLGEIYVMYILSSNSDTFLESKTWTAGHGELVGKSQWSYNWWIPSSALKSGSALI